MRIPERILRVVVLGLLVASVGWAQTGEELRGVVVESVEEGSALEEAGLRPGDVICFWRRLANPPANPETAYGDINSPFDWAWLDIEQAPRGKIELQGKRDSRRITISASMDPSRVTVRAIMTEGVYDLYSSGATLIKDGNRPEGIKLWEQAATLVEHADASQNLQCWILFQIGEEWAKGYNWEETEEAFGQAREKMQDETSQFLVNLAFGKIYDKQGEYAKAEELYAEAATALATVTPSDLSSASILHHLAIVAWRRGDLDAAEEKYRKSLSIRERYSPDGIATAASLNNLGVIAVDRGELRLAESYYQRALRIKERLTPGGISLTSTLTNLGIVARSRGDLDLAEKYFTRTLEIERQIAPTSLQVAGSLADLGTLETARGNADLAMKLLQEALAMREDIAPISRGTATTLISIGNVQLDENNLASAEKYYARALKMYFDIGLKGPLVAIALNNLGLVSLESGDLDLATERFRRSLEINQESAPRSLTLAATLNSMGFISMKRNQPKVALEYMQQALDIAEISGRNNLLTADIYYKMGTLFRMAGRLQLAADHFARSIEVLEKQIQMLGSSREDEGRYRAMQGDVFLDAINLWVERGGIAEAFHLMEIWRAQSFLAMLKERDLSIFQGVPQELDQRQRLLAREYDNILRSMRDLKLPEEETRIKSLQGEQLALRQRQQQLQKEIRESYTDTSFIEYSQPLHPEKVRQQLDDKSILMAYSVGDTKTHVFIIDPAMGLTNHTLDIGETELRKEIRRFRMLLSDGRPGRVLGNERAKSFRESSRYLYQLLLTGGEERIETSSRILLLPDGPLHYLPFSALIRANGQYVAEWKPIHLALSATTWYQLKELRQSLDKSAFGSASHSNLTAFGDPYYPETVQALQSTDSQVESVRSEDSFDFRVRAALVRDIFDWSPLPGTRREVEEIAKLFKESDVYLGKKATEEQLKDLGENPGIVHIAAHSYLDDRFPWNSGIALTIPETLREDCDNGLLQVWEITESLRFSSDLVVLSACETGIGEERGGEGLIGLTRAFQHAGARSVAASLWNVNDQTTAELMIRFYRHLRSGLSKDEALRAAQLEFIRSPIEVTDADGNKVLKDASAPYYWAAFQIYGDWK